MVDGVDDKFSLVNRLKSLSLCFTMPIGKEAADEIERLQERVRELYEELLDRYTQTRCGCDHPACKRCRDDRDTEAVLARARGEDVE